MESQPRRIFQKTRPLKKQVIAQTKKGFEDDMSGADLDVRQDQN